MALIPAFGSKGIFELLSPFKELLQPGIEYTCESTRKFSDLIEEGVEPFDEIYDPLKIPRAKYEEDVLVDAAIIRLRSSQFHWVTVPSTYITGVPNPNGVPYQAMLLGIALGALPVDLKLDSLKATIVSVVKDYLGVESVVEEVVVSDVTAISHEDHEAYEAARKSQIVMNESDRSKAVRMQTTIDALTAKIAELDAYIIQNYVP